MLSEGTGRELLEEMRQKTLCPYNTAQISQISAEIEYADAKIEALKREAEHSDVSEALSINFAMLRAYRERNLRILRAYTLHRLSMIRDNYFDKRDIKELLSADEIAFEREYGEILEEYIADYRHLDLKNREPPLSLYVQIVPLEDCGLVMSGDDFIDLRRGRLYFLRKADIAHLIKQRLVRLL